MDYDENIEQLIEAYINKTLNEEQVMMVEEKMQVDMDFAEEVHLYRALTTMVEVAGDVKMKQRFQEIDKHLQKKTNTSRFAWLGRRSWLGMVASILIIIVAAIWLLNPNQHDTDTVFATHFEPYRTPLSVRNTTQPNIDEEWETAIQYYMKEDYTTAADLLNQLAQNDDKENYMVYFYLGVCHLAKKKSDPNAAITYFKKVQQIDNDFTQQAEWYIGLAYLKAGDTVNAKIVFTNILNQGYYKKEEAKLILRELKE